MDFRTHYDNLQILENASDAVIRAAYRALSQQHHPDRNPDDVQRSTQRMGLINRAYQVLSDPELRAEHDAWIRRQRKAHARSMPPTFPAYPDKSKAPERPSNGGTFDQTWQDLRTQKPLRKVKQQQTELQKSNSTEKNRKDSATEELSLFHVLIGCVVASGYITVNSSFYRNSYLAGKAWYELIFESYFLGLIVGRAIPLIIVALLVWAALMILKPTRKHASFTSGVITLILFVFLLANPDGLRKDGLKGEPISDRASPTSVTGRVLH